MWKEMYGAFSVAGGSCVECAMTLESVSVGTEDYKFENEKNLEVWSEKDSHNRPEPPTELSAVKAAVWVMLEPGFNKTEESVE